MNFYDDYLTQQSITRYKIAKETGISPSTLQRAADAKEIDNISMRIIIATAKALDKTPGTVADELINVYNQYK